MIRVAVSGATGLVGGALSSRLTQEGHEVIPLVRHAASGSELLWNPSQGGIEKEPDTPLDAIVHLAGENIAGRWSASKKQRIRDSRVQGTRALCESLARWKQKPSTLVCASAIGFYGNRGDELLEESAAPGTGFLAETCRDWEQATSPARDAGLRVVSLRIGVVLSKHGGALKQMLGPFRMGAGGRMGPGTQFMSWIHRDDVIGLICHALQDSSLRGPLNAVSPHPVTNQEFTKTLGKVLRRPTLFPMPTFAVRLVFGEMGEELLLSSTRVSAATAVAAGYSFQFAQLEEALRKEI